MKMHVHREKMNPKFSNAAVKKKISLIGNKFLLLRKLGNLSVTI